MKNTLIITLILSFILTSCDGNKKTSLDGDFPLSDLDDMLENDDDKKPFNTVEINNTYGIEVPKYMKEANDLNDEASLQYDNVFTETYVIVIDEPIGDFIATYKGSDIYKEEQALSKNYRDVQLDILAQSFNIKKKSATKSVTINGLDAETIELDCEIEGLDEEISYFFTFIAGEENLYMVMAWTLESRKEKYRSDLERIGSSFYLIE